MIQMLLTWIADALVILGLLVMTLAVYGMIWLPDLYTRLHAASKAVFLGIIPILVAASTTGEPGIISRAILIGIFLLLTTTVAAHTIGRAAYLKKEPPQTPDDIDESGYLSDSTPPRDGVFMDRRRTAGSEE